MGIGIQGYGFWVSCFCGLGVKDQRTQLHDAEG